MNVLLEKFPRYAKINGKKYEICTDFRNCLKIILACQDDELTDEEKLWVILKRLYQKEMPNDIEKAFNLGIQFLDGGKEQRNDSKSTAAVSSSSFSFSQDAAFIYSAVLQTHGVDLESCGNLHWWKFLMMLQELDKDCAFYHIIGIRERKKQGKMTKEDKAWYAKNKELVDIKKPLTSLEEMKRKEFLERIKQGGGGENAGL